MAVYRVTMRGTGIRATFNGEEIPCGFFKNEFVWARDREMAVSSARQKIETALRKNRTVSPNLSGLELSVEEVEDGLSMLSLLGKQGFIFHRLDGDAGQGK